jgi:ribosome-associated protein
MDSESRIIITPRLSIGMDELQFSFIRSSGPGGQNVNKVASAVQMRFDAAHSPALTPEMLRRLLRMAGRRATSAGEIVITAQRFRTQVANRRDAIERLSELLRAASVEPKRRVKTRPTRAARARRIEAKKHRGTVKQGRARQGWD